LLTQFQIGASIRTIHYTSNSGSSVAGRHRYCVGAPVPVTCRSAHSIIAAPADSAPPLLRACWARSHMARQTTAKAPGPSR
jgi:hypothetical protein